MSEILVYCDRCKNQVRDAYQTDTVTAGFYNVTPGTDGRNQWAQYARIGERNVCDTCMWADPKYIAEHGKQITR